MPPPIGASPPDSARWHVVAICFLILNCALGVNFAAYGAMVAAIEREFSTSRALASGGLSMLTLALGLIAPMVGTLMRRVPVRLLMAVGIALNALGYLALTQAHHIGAMLAVYGLMIGPGFALFGIVPCTAIISNWFDAGRGKALGIINMPAGNTLMPLLAAWLLGQYGLHGAFLGCALILAALLPLLLLLVDQPGPVGRPLPGHDAPAMLLEPPLSATHILRHPAFLILTAGVTLLSASGLVMVTHLVTLATDRGVDLAAASLLLAAFGVAGIVGAPLFGWIADRIGGGHALALLALCQIPPWLALIGAGNSLPLLLALAFAIGACSNAILTLFGVVMADWLGQTNVGLGMGLCYLIQIPFMFGAGPLAGAMVDRFGSYTPTILLHVASFVAIGLIFLFYRPRPVALTPSRPSAARS